MFGYNIFITHKGANMEKGIHYNELFNPGLFGFTVMDANDDQILTVQELLDAFTNGQDIGKINIALSIALNSDAEGIDDFLTDLQALPAASVLCEKLRKEKKSVLAR